MHISECPAAAHYSGVLRYLWVKVCVRAKGKIMESNRDEGCTLPLCSDIFYIVSLQRQANISVSDGQHVILML